MWSSNERTVLDGAAATMIDGFPMSRRGEAVRALSAAISTSWVNGLIWGVLVFLFLMDP